MGSIVGTIASIVIGAALATGTIVGVVSSQTSASGDSPANVEKPEIQYGSN